MDDNRFMENKPKHMRFLFWFFWVLFMAVMPLYLFTLLFQVNGIDFDKLTTIILPIVGVTALVSQVFVFVKSLKRAKQGSPFAKAFVILFGGTLLVAAVWVGSCALFGPCQLLGY